ncbi:hypothetical protein FGG08_004198 [Glutinoglossum americanum]|uniref:Uncharacterized protein n=1 Tax=Glutinoglossum americanum TaxID=1670608 RepID=A0A9P8HWX7_9PEZI|nr:hypothetical protein FGG08_004198 [Glutinoglossum americanum]
MEHPLKRQRLSRAARRGAIGGGDGSSSIKSHMASSDDDEGMERGDLHFVERQYRTPHVVKDVYVDRADAIGARHWGLNRRIAQDSPAAPTDAVTVVVAVADTASTQAADASSTVSSDPSPQLPTVPSVPAFPTFTLPTVPAYPFTTTSPPTISPTASSNFSSFGNSTSSETSAASSTDTGSSSSTASSGNGFGGGGPGNSGASSTPTSGAGSGSGTGPGIREPAVIGGLVGGLAGVALILILVLLIIRSKKAKLRRHTMEPAVTGGPSSDLSGSWFGLAGLLKRFRPAPPQVETSEATSSGEKRFYKVSGRKIPSVLGGGGGDGFGGGYDKETLGGPHDPYGAGPSGDRGGLGGSGTIIATRPSPARTPVISHSPTRESLQGRPLRPFRDGLGRSHPSEDGSKASRFVEDV